MGGQLCLECKKASLHGVYQRKAQHPLAAVALVVPIVGYLVCILIPITSAVGLWLSRKVLRELDIQPNLSGRSVALAAQLVSASTLVHFLIATLATVIMRFMA